MVLKVAEFYPGYRMPVLQGVNAPGVAFGADPVNDNPFKKLANDVDRLDMAQKALYVGGVLPPLRRLGSLPDSIGDNNWVRAGLLTTMAAANLPGDLREIMRAKDEFRTLGKGIISFIKNPKSKDAWTLLRNSLPSAANYKGQHAMNVLDGTFLEPLTKIKWLKNLDKPLYSTKFGTFLVDHFNIAFDPNKVNGMSIPGFKIKNFHIDNRIVNGINFEGNYMQRLLGKSLLRVSTLGVIISGALELPALVKSVTETKGSVWDKTKAFTKQLIKSSGYVALVTAGVVLTGGIFGATALGSLAGMALGSALGLMGSKALNKEVDKLFGQDKKEQQINPFAIPIAYAQ